ncbi:MAG: DUF3866 family protein [Halanaerobium sp.]|nr:DUF3866 family protein [Halanaerobium sp.]
MEGVYHAKRARVLNILDRRAGLWIIAVEVEGKEEKAVHFPLFWGQIAAGDEVFLNVTAAQLGLGSGGYHFVAGIAGQTGEATEGEGLQQVNGKQGLERGQGHIMKLRYTPLQFARMSVEEPASPYHQLLAKGSDAGGLPVIIGELHSMLAPVVIALRERSPAARIAYIMPDSGALPLKFSELVQELSRRYGLTATITTGHAFGGELEAVNVYSALLAASKVLRADYVVMAMGPGIVGTGTRLGFSGLDQADWLNAAEKLGCLPLLIPRISQADTRERHRGLSHHSRTVLECTFARAYLAVDPAWFEPGGAISSAGDDLEWLQGLPGHKIWYRRWNDELESALQEGADLLHSMGRTYQDDPIFFRAPALAAELAVDLKEGIPVGADEC